VDYMKKHFLALSSVFFLTIIFTGCQKDELTLPVSVDMNIRIEPSSLSYISFDGGQVLFKHLIFEGHRAEGGDIYFNTQPGKEMGPISFSDAKEGAFIKNFDIPQGVYNQMEWELQLSSLPPSLFPDDEDYENDDEDNHPGLLLTGTYRQLNGTYIPISLVIDAIEKFTAHTSHGERIESQTLSAGKAYSAYLTFDPSYATAAISRQSLEDAEINDDFFSPFIEISSDENDQLYEHILYRLQNSVKIIIN